MSEENKREFIMSRLNIEKRAVMKLSEEEILVLINELDAIRAESVEEGRYLDADNAKNKIKQVTGILDKKRKRNMRSKHNMEKHKLDEDFESEMQSFSGFWDEKIMKYQEECRQLEKMLLGKNEEELEDYNQSLNKTIPLKFKPSPKMLEMHATLNQLLKSQQYRDAHYLQQKICLLEKQEEEKYFYERDRKIEKLLQAMKTRHNQEYNTLKKKIILGLEELEINRKKEYEKLLLKFNNIKKNIENQHNMENYYFEKSVKASQITKSVKTPFGLYQGGNQYDEQLEEGENDQMMEPVEEDVEPGMEVGESQEGNAVEYHQG